MAENHTTHGSPELDADAAKLLAMGADPGPAWCGACGGTGLRFICENFTDCSTCGGEGIMSEEPTNAE